MAKTLGEIYLSEMSAVERLIELANYHKQQKINDRMRRIRANEELIERLQARSDILKTEIMEISHEEGL